METKIPNALVLLIFLFSSQAFGAHWSWNYRVLRSPHFEVIYRDTQKKLAERYVQAAEKSYNQLLPIFKEAPDRTILFLNDDTDSANGLANFLPYPHIVVYPTLPTTADSIDDYGDWPYEMVLHEYTHILNMYPAHGMYQPFKYIFGSVTRPNAILPRWYLEGLAVDLETALSDHGRLRSPETDAAGRALVASQKLRTETIDRINESDIPSWPFGGRPYLFGAWWWENAHLEKGDSLIYDLNQEFARRAPFLLDTPLLIQTGKTTEQLLSATYDRVEKRATRQLNQLQASNPPAALDLVDEKGQQNIFAISPSGQQMVYLHSQRLIGTTVKLKTKKSLAQSFKEAPSEILIKTAGTMQVRWLGEDQILFDQIDTQNPYVNFRDLYLLNVHTKNLRRLTFQARAQEASPSPSGKKAAFIQNEGGHNQLALLDLATGSIQALARGNFDQRISGPEFLDDQQIVFSLRGRDGLETLHVFDLNQHTHRLWNNTLKSAQHLRRVPNGFLVTDASTHARNVYWLHDNKTEPVSNTLTHIESADYDAARKELVFTELTAEGQRLRSIPFGLQSPPQILKEERPKVSPPADLKLKVQEEDYNPASYMLPSYWIPFVFQVEGGVIVQGLTSQNDPVGRNAYNLMGSYDTVTRKGSYGASYVNSSLPTNISVGYARAQTYLGASGQTFDSQVAQVGFSQFWPFSSRQMSWTGGALWSDTFGRYRRLGPQLSFSYSNLDSPLRFWSSYLFEASHQQFVQQLGYVSFGRTTLQAANRLQLGGGHKLWLQGRLAYAPGLGTNLSRNVLLGDRNVGGNYLFNLANSDFLLRGYPSGEFSGRNVVNANFEYSPPPFRWDRGWGTMPLFLRQAEVALFVDSMAVDGFAIDIQKGYVPVTVEQFHIGTGAELRLSTTAAYHLPLTFTFGLYYGFNDRYAGGFSPFIGIGMNQFGPLGSSHKTP